MMGPLAGVAAGFFCSVAKLRRGVYELNRDSVHRWGDDRAYETDSEDRKGTCLEVRTKFLNMRQRETSSQRAWADGDASFTPPPVWVRFSITHSSYQLLPVKDCLR